MIKWFTLEEKKPNLDQIVILKTIDKFGKTIHLVARSENLMFWILAREEKIKENIFFGARFLGDSIWIFFNFAGEGGLCGEDKHKCCEIIGWRPIGAKMIKHFDKEIKNNITTKNWFTLQEKRPMPDELIIVKSCNDSNQSNYYVAVYEGTIYFEIIMPIAKNNNKFLEGANFSYDDNQSQDKMGNQEIQYWTQIDHAMIKYLNKQLKEVKNDVN